MSHVAHSSTTVEIVALSMETTVPHEERLLFRTNVVLMISFF